MQKSLAELQATLIEGQRRSQQGSYLRRAPSPKAVPFLIEARAGLKAYVKEHENEAQGWRLLSYAEECLLNYTSACSCLEKAMSISGQRDRKDLKRLALMREQEKEWAQLNLTPDELSNLRKFLDAKLERNGCDHTLRFTKSWLKESGVEDPKRVLEAVREQGGFCDCEVVVNIVAD